MLNRPNGDLALSSFLDQLHSSAPELEPRVAPDGPPFSSIRISVNCGGSRVSRVGRGQCLRWCVGHELFYSALIRCPNQLFLADFSLADGLAGLMPSHRGREQTAW